jgi:lycopene cyclase CruA
MTPVDRARGLVREAGGDVLLERLEHLDGVRRAARKTRAAAKPEVRAPEPGDAVDADVVLAGGGLWSLLAPLLASRGLRVCVVERARAGQTHREWNASARELEALVDCGLVGRSTLERFVVAKYRRGTCRFAGGGEYPTRGVLDRAVDAAALLEHARSAAEDAGARFLDGHEVVAHAASDAGTRVLVRARNGATFPITARVMVDARGASSPYATADLVCPTVGGVVEGLAEGTASNEIDPSTGEILATIDGVEDGRQHVWEAFPGRPRQTTVYLFCYARADEPAERTSLLALYARFFATLPSYKRGEARLLRPTFGFIPGWSRLSPAPRAPHPRVMLVGDAAARHSPLTYCGFGAALRSLAGTADEVARRVERLGAEGACDDAPIHALTGALARLMASGAFHGDALNRLLDAAFATLHELGEESYAALLRDEMRPADFVAFLRRTAVRHPAVWRQVMVGLGPWTAARWGAGVARSVWSAQA